MEANLYHLFPTDCIHDAQVMLDMGMILGQPMKCNDWRTYVLDPEFDPCVLQYLPQTAYDYMLAQPGYTESLLLCPGCGPGYYLHKEGNEYAVRYEVEIYYRNRRFDKIQI